MVREGGNHAVSGVLACERVPAGAHVHMRLARRTPSCYAEVDLLPRTRIHKEPGTCMHSNRLQYLYLRHP